MNAYRPNEALDLLINKLQERDATLATLVRDAINAGTEGTLVRDAINAETEGTPLIDNRGDHSQTERSHEYRKIVPFSPEESLQVALDVLQAVLIERPLLINEIAKNFTETSEIQIELHTETQSQIVEEDDHEFRLTPIPEEDIEEQRQNLDLLKELMTFSGE